MITAGVELGAYRDDRYAVPVSFVTIDAYGLPSVFVTPADRPEVLCEVGSGYDFGRVTREELRAWALAILQATG